MGGCASTRSQNDRDGERLCVRVREIKGYNPLDGRHVLIKARGRDNYLFTLDRSCDRLAFARGIAIVGTANRVCNDGFDLLSFTDPSTGVRRCRIRAIDAVEDIDAARALIAAREAD